MSFDGVVQKGKGIAVLLAAGLDHRQLRQFFPKGTDFSRISHQEVARVEQLLNERPRKRIGYRTPSEILKRRLCRN